MKPSRPKVLALILAGGQGGRLEVLTEKRAKPVLPFAGMYRLIDFALSNCMHSHVSDVWVIEQYQPHSLNEHLANGRPWDLDRTYGGLQVLPPYIGRDDEGGFAEGNADAIYRHKEFLREFDPDILLVLSADHVYKLDYGEVIARHQELRADVTMVTTRVPLAEASRFGTVKVDPQGRITDFAYKPEQPESDIVTTEVFVYDAHKLLDTLDELVNSNKSTSESKEDNRNGSSLKDFGHELLPRLVREGQAHDFPLEGYWKDVGTVESYWEAHMELLGAEPPLMLDDPAWPILTVGAQRMPARIHESANVVNSLISPGCVIYGEVINSILAPGVIIEQSAVVRDSILLHEARVGSGAQVYTAVLDAKTQVDETAVVGSRGKSPKGRTLTRRSTEEIILIGMEARISAGALVPPGTRVKPGAVKRKTQKPTKIEQPGQSRPKTKAAAR
ncbi:MAG: glucose-1-phosphate adenylyltransferase [Acidobacteriota bacterium]|nr:glucose-1-phosphate adenylyltransferase [Acidobacteriota bacterium]